MNILWYLVKVKRQKKLEKSTKNEFDGVDSILNKQLEILCPQLNTHAVQYKQVFIHFQKTWYSHTFKRHVGIGFKFLKTGVWIIVSQGKRRKHFFDLFPVYCRIWQSMLLPRHSLKHFEHKPFIHHLESKLFVESVSWSLLGLHYMLLSWKKAICADSHF